MRDVVQTGREAPLAGLRAVEISNFGQGPIGGMVLAELGVDVVKIEQVGKQDVYRGGFERIHGVKLDDRGKEWLFTAANRGKRVMALDVASADGEVVFRKLIESADIFLTNMRQPGLEKLGADYESVRAINPRIIYGRGGGLGFEGPRAGDACQDTIGMAYAGMMDSLAETETPTYPPGSMADTLAGTHLAAAILAGVVRRGLTGQGCLVGATQLQSLIWLQLLHLGTVANLGQRMERYDPVRSNPLLRPYQTADGWVVLVAILPHQWPQIATALGLEDLLGQDRLPTLQDALGHPAEVTERMSAVMRTRPSQEWLRLFEELGVWTSPVNTLEDLVNDPQVLANDYIVRFSDGFIGPSGPFEVGDYRPTEATAAGYGENTDEVLKELGYSAEEIMKLRIVGAIW